jgi:hypothetical protein
VIELQGGGIKPRSILGIGDVSWKLLPRPHGSRPLILFAATR